MAVSDLPALNAALNAVAAVLLTCGLVFIKRGRRVAHRNCMVSAFAVSIIFLVSYVVHKILVRGVHTHINATDFIRRLYFTMLFTHIVLAIAIVPLALITLSRARKENFEAHKRIARWTWPIWMYVSVTGVLVYFFLYVWFPE
ncbi:MAG TPA: DUF420 domain-containing protein [Verrucomicrobiae bacterium]